MPSKKKKPKTSHHHGKERDRELSQAEIWDDSALVRSWEDAVREYEYYHSLAAQGIDPEAVVDAAEEAERNGEDVSLALDDTSSRNPAHVNGTRHGGGITDNEIEDGEIEEDIDETEAQDSKVTNVVAPKNGVHGKQHGPPLPPEREAEQPQPLPEDASTTQVQNTPGVNTDQTLENLKMAYYWAGYYSGLYDGQRKAASATGGNNSIGMKSG